MQYQIISQNEKACNYPMLCMGILRLGEWKATEVMAFRNGLWLMKLILLNQLIAHTIHY
jgi:hypothetical protein